jgi:predicted solute-binding protein
MQTIRIGHSPDPDDAFMFYALTARKVTIPACGSSTCWRTSRR